MISVDTLYALRLSAEQPNLKRVVNAYVIFYIVEDDHVQIVRILHGARDYVAVLGADDTA